MDTLEWLGLDWDHEPLVQSQDLSPYLNRMETLAESGSIYRCHLGRRRDKLGRLGSQRGGWRIGVPRGASPGIRGRSVHV